LRPEVMAWLEKAEWDLENAQLMYNNKRWSTSAYHAHQSAEKASKALLFSIGKTPWGHVISVLLADYLQTAQEVRIDLVDCAKDLDRHYIPARYPFGSMDIPPHKLYTKKVAEEAKSCA